MTMLGITACLVLAVRVLHRGTWGRWAAYGGGQLVLLWTNPGLPLHVALMNVAVAATLWRRHRRTPALTQQGVRFAAAGGLGALAWLQLMAPNLAQLPAYLEHTRGFRDLGERWVREVSSKIFSGMAWHHPGERGLDPIYPELADLVAVEPTGVWTVGLAAGAALAVGAVRLLRRGGFHAWLPWVLLVPAPWSGPSAT